MIEILIVDDEPAICEMLSFSLANEGYLVKVANDANQALTMLNKSIPDIALIDWMMPGMNGVELVRYLRSEPTTQRLPIIMLTAKDSQENKLEGFSGGADDYIIKPFSNHELKARLKALLRRSLPYKMQQEINDGDLILDPQKGQAYAFDSEISMTPIEFKLLYFLVTHKDQVFSRMQLLDNVWGIDKHVSERTVDVQIRRLRDKLKASIKPDLHKRIKTVRSLGYCYNDK